MNKRVDPTFRATLGAPKVPNRIQAQAEAAMEAAYADVPTEVSQEHWLAIKRVTIQDDFKEFVKEFWSFFHPGQQPAWNWHMDAICDHLQAQSRGQIKRLIINIPPGAGKSILVGVMRPCWEWTWNPGCQILATASDMNLAKRDNQRAKWLMESKQYQRLFPLGLKSDSASVAKFTNEKMGFREAVAFTSITGHRGHRVIIDDPISAADVMSDAARNGVNDNYWRNVPSRTNSKDSTFTIVQQRLHMNDLVGDILEKDKRWETLILPMEFKKDYYLCRNSIGFRDPRKEVGELLFPAFWDEESVQGFRDAGAFQYAAQYQQNPVPEADGYLNRNAFKRYTTDKSRVTDDRPLLPRKLHYYITSDAAMGISGRSDWNVVRVWGIDADKNLYLVDSFREQCKLQDALGISSAGGKLKVSDRGGLAFVRKYKPLCWYIDGDNMVKSNLGILKDTMAANEMWVRLEVLNASGKGSSKLERANGLQTMSNLGKIYLPDNQIGDTALEEYQAFPVGKHDDQVDADAIMPRMMSTSHAAIEIPDAPRGELDPYRGNDDESGEPENYYSFF